MSEFTTALGLVAPYYNLAFVVIIIYLFFKLFNTEARAKTLLPWKILFIALCVYILEEGLTVLRKVGWINIPVHINGFFELIIITLFIYTLLKQIAISKK